MLTKAKELQNQEIGMHQYISDTIGADTKHLSNTGTPPNAPIPPSILAPPVRGRYIFRQYGYRKKTWGSSLAATKLPDWSGSWGVHY